MNFGVVTFIRSESPLDLKIKANMLSDMLSIVGK